MDPEIEKLEAQLESAEVIDETSDVSLVEVFEGDSGKIEILEEATVSALKIEGLPAKEDREMVLRAKVGQAGKMNRNGRVYPMAIMQREVASLSEKIESRSAFSNDQHPRRKKSADGKSVEMVDLPTFGSTTFIPYKIEMNESGEVFSTGVIPKTDSGRNFAAVIRAGGKPGFSTRGGGTVKKQKIQIDGVLREALVVQENYRMKTFDTVIDQSVEDAKILELTESQDPDKGQTVEENRESIIVMKYSDWAKKYPEAASDLSEAIESLNADTVKSNFPVLHESIRKVTAKSLEEEVQEKLIKGQEEYLDGVRSELIENEKEDLKAQAIVEFCEELGIENGDELKTLVESQGLSIPELLKMVLEESAKHEDETPTDESTENNTEDTTMNIDEAIANNPAIKELIDSNKKLTALLAASQKKEAINECRVNFPYGSKILDENIVPLLEKADTAEEVNDLYENQVTLLKAAGAKEVAKGSAKFLATDEDKSIDESAEENEPVDEATSLINSAASSFAVEETVGA